MSWARDLITSEVMGESVGREVAKVLAPPLQAPEITPFPDPYQTLTVPAGETLQVYYFKVPFGNIGFIQAVGNNYYPDTYLYWYIDGRLVESPSIERQIAFVNAPKQITPWLRVTQETRWVVKNTGTDNREMEILCDGFYTPLNDVAKLLKLGLPISE